MVAAMNPCPCGNFGDERLVCTCAPGAASRYTKKVSGPLLDRMDIQVSVPRESALRERSGPDIEGFHAAKVAVLRARQAQSNRLGPARTNSMVGYRDIERLCAADTGAVRLMEQAVDRHRLSLRTYHRIRRVARTIADMDGAGTISAHHAAEAVALRLTPVQGI
jgi:magnesium chelatase family protein